MGDLLATQVMAPMDDDLLLATQVMVQDMLATQAMGPAGDMLAAHAAAPTLDELLASVEGPPEPLAAQAVAPAAAAYEPLATQVYMPVAEPPERRAEREERRAEREERRAEREEPFEELKQVKRPKNAFWLFQEAFRSQVAGLGPQAVGQAVVSAVAAKWKCLEESEKARYLERARGLMAEFKREVADGAVPAPSVKSVRAARAAERAAERAKKARAAAKGRQARQRAAESARLRPKRPRSSYAIWLSEHRQEVRESLVGEGAQQPSFAEVARAAGRTWRELGAEQKAPFEQRAQQLAAEFKAASSACAEHDKAKAKGVKSKAAKKTKKQEAGGVRKQRAGKAKGAAAEAAGAGPSEHKAVETPRKRASGAPKGTPKKARRAAAAAAAYLDMALVAEAEKAGFAETFRKLAEREDMKPYPQRALLDALAANGGLLHRAKEAVLAAKA